MKKLTPQDKKVLAFLETHDHITAAQAIIVFRIFRLAARIWSIREYLRENGGDRDIETTRKYDAAGTQYAEYRLVNVVSPVRVNLRPVVSRETLALAA